MKFPKQALREAMWEDESWTLEGLRLEWKSDWTGGHKGESRTYVFSYHDKFYSIDDHRSGSDYSKWYYSSKEDWSDYVECDEVEKKEVVTLKWVKVK